MPRLFVLLALAAATKIWRRMFGDEETLAKEGLAFMKKMWGAEKKAAKPAKKPAKKKGRRR